MNLFDKIKAYLKLSGGLIGTLAALTAVLVFLFAIFTSVIMWFIGLPEVRNHINERVDIKLEDPLFLEKIGKLVRPSIIFDSGGSILYDQGAGEFITGLEIVWDESRKPKEWVPERITVKLSQTFSSEPILTSLENEFGITAQRVEGNNWSYNLRDYGNYSCRENDKCRFRIELLW